MNSNLKEKALEYARRLVRIQSVTFQERECAEELAGMLEDLGFHTSLDEGNNLVARLSGRDPDAPVLMFIGHHDTVDLGDLAEWDQPPLEAVVTENPSPVSAEESRILHGRGSNDEKGGLAGFLAAVECLSAGGWTPEGDLLLVSTREETADFSERGILRVLSYGLKADACICLEPTETRMMLGHRGRAVIDFTVRGKAAHASMPSKGINAIGKAARLIDAIERMPLPGTDPDWTGTQAVTMIQGGIKENILPEECRFSVDRRILDGEDENTLRGEYDSVIRGLSAADPQLAVTYEIRPPYYAARTPETDGFVRMMKEILRDLDLASEPEIFPGHTDAEWVINDMGIPCVIIGPGSLSTAHTAHEYVPVADLGIVSEVYLQAIRQFWQN